MIAVEEQCSLSETEKLRWDQLRGEVLKSTANFWEMITNLKEIHERRLYRDDYESFGEYVDIEVRVISRNRAFELFGALETRNLIRSINQSPDSLSINSLLRLKDVPAEKLPRILSLAAVGSDEKRITSTDIIAAKAKVLPTSRESTDPRSDKLPTRGSGKRSISSPLQKFKLFVRYIGVMTCFKLIHGYATEEERAKFREYIDSPEARRAETSVKKKIENLWLEDAGDYAVPVGRRIDGKSIAVKASAEICLKRYQPRLNLEAGAVLVAELTVGGWALLLDKEGDVLELGPDDFRLATAAVAC